MSAPNPFEQSGFVLAQKIEDVGSGLKLFTFPDGFRCYSHSSEQETLLIYNEIFVQQEYLGAPISLDTCHCIFDVGANIGLFTLFVKLRDPRLVVHAFEPIKATYDVLAKNVALHGLTGVHLHNFALSAQDGIDRTFTFYPHAAGNTTAHPESKVELKHMLIEVLGQEQADYLFQGEQAQTVQSRTLSALIQQSSVPGIDLLKIDTEGDELAVLQGIADMHFPMIRQIAVEVHSEILSVEIEQLLASKGFSVHSNTGIASGNNVYAVRG